MSKFKPSPVGLFTHIFGVVRFKIWHYSNCRNNWIILSVFASRFWDLTSISEVNIIEGASIFAKKLKQNGFKEKTK